MTLKEQLESGGDALFIRENGAGEHLSVFPRADGKYWLVVQQPVAGKPRQTIDCASFDDLISHLRPGEAESDEWFDL